MTPFALRTVVCLLLLTLTPPSLVGAQDDEYTLGTTEVTLDVVARDKRGRPVTSLQLSDFTVLEDGVEQEIASFRLVTASEVPSAESTTAEAGAAPVPRSLTTAPEESKAIAIVFDGLTPDARGRAHKAASKYVAENVRAGDAVGVFLVDLSLVSLLPYTTDRRAIAEAVDAAGGAATAAYRANQEAIRRLKGSSGGTPQLDVESAGPTLGGSESTSDSRGPDNALRAMNLNSLEAFERLQRHQQGFATTNALLGVVEGLKLLPGRKAILFFSEGVSIPPPVRSHFEAVISSANQARVSIYAVDAAGLRVDSVEAGVGRDVYSVASQRINEIGTPGEGSGRAMLRNLEGLDDTMRSSPYASLGRLAKETGGYLVSDTNDIGDRLDQIDEDLRTYYVLTYAPKNPSYDGSFRRVSVRVRRSGVSVQTREGYYAINAIDSPPVLPYEAPAVAAAMSERPRTEFAIRSLATSFPEPDRPGLAPVMVAVPASAATFMQDHEKKRFATAFTVVVLVRDETRRIVAKTSKEYILVGPLEELEATRRGDLLFYDELDLAPGRYTVEAAGYDAPSRKASVHRTSLEVSPVDAGGLRLSSVTIIDRAERVPKGPKGEAGDKPFYVGDALLYPNLGTPLRKTAGGSLAFFVTAYVAEDGSEAPKASLEILQQGRTLARLPIELPAPDARGRIHYTNAVPLSAIPPGSYELRITATDGARSAARSVQFTIVR